MNIFDCVNFRIYLKKYYAVQKSESPGFTYARFSKLANLGSPNYLKLVIEGSRNLTVCNIHQFATALELSLSEIEYFEAMVLNNQSKNANEKAYYKRRMVQISKQQNVSSEKFSKHEILKKWYMPSVLLCLHERTMQSAKLKISNELMLPSSEIENVIQELINLKIVTVENERFKIHTQRLLVRDSKSKNIQLKNYLSEQLKQSFAAFNRSYNSGEAKFVAHTMTVPENAIEAIITRFHALCDTMTQEYDENLGEDFKIAQVNVQVFHPRALA